ncbi:MAG: FAD-dependent oxidoreductase [Alphaproteobacteria bacterium]|nr:FAD-dependent oxidoreductase [Alphaproteobacteria bacterium]
MSIQPNYLVVGAGVAGIAAARALQARGLPCVVLEAKDRIGGRAYTDATGFDHGASWLHQANDNPLTVFAEAFGFETVDHDKLRQRLLFTEGRFGTTAERQAFAAAEDHFWRVIEAAAADGAPDRPASDAAPGGGRFDALVAHCEGAQICAAELSRMSLHDFAATALDGPNLLLRRGLGTLVSTLAEGLPIRLNAPVAQLDWSGNHVEASGAFGRVRARAAIITVSTGVLAQGGITFTPDLPAEKQAAIKALPLGLLNKLAFPMPPGVLPEFGPLASLRRDIAAAGDRPISWIARPFGAPMMLAFIGGSLAWKLSRAGKQATEAHARAEFARIFGAEAAVALGPPIISDWGGDPHFLGSYSHAKPGGQAARRVLAEPLADGRLIFAGEACHARFAGTVAGAWLSGDAAAQLIMS